MPVHPVPDGEPQMVLIGPPAIEPPGVPVDPGDVELKGLVRVFGLDQRQSVPAKLVEGLLQHPEELLPVLLEPGPLVMKRQIPQKLARLGGKAAE